MNKPYIFSLAVILIVVAFGAGYYLGGVPDQVKEVKEEENGFALGEVETGSICHPYLDIVLDGTVEGVSGNQISIIPKDVASQIDLIELTSESVVKEITLSSRAEIVLETNFDASDFEKGDSFSAVVSCGLSEEDVPTVREIRKMIVQIE